MKKSILLIIFLVSFLSSYSQELSPLKRNTISLDFGSYRNRYVYPMNNLRYTTPLLRKIPLKFTIRLRSYGTWYLYSKSSYDLTPMAAYYFIKSDNPLCFSAGLGLDARIRLVRDERSVAKSSMEPLISLGAHYNHQKFSVDLPLWSRFYSNGISFTMLPEASFHISKKITLFLRYEISYLTIYKVRANEWRQDCFLGTQLTF